MTTDLSIYRKLQEVEDEIKEAAKKFGFENKKQGYLDRIESLKDDIKNEKFQGVLKIISTSREMSLRAKKKGLDQTEPVRILNVCKDYMKNGLLDTALEEAKKAYTAYEQLLSESDEK